MTNSERSNPLLQQAQQLQRAGRLAEAERAYRMVLAQEPSHLGALHELEALLFNLRRFDEGARVCEQALAIDPNDLIALSHMCLARHALGQTDAADAALDRALAVPCHTAEQWFHRGLALTGSFRTPEAYEAYRKALRLDPNFLVARVNLGESAALLGKSDESLAAYEAVVQAAPHSAVAHLGYSMALLLRGDLERGFPEHVWRWQSPTAPPPLDVPQPIWRNEDVRGKTILLHAEQGFGDTIQFARYATKVNAERGARVILQVQQPLVELMRTSAGVERVIAQGDTLPPFDFHFPIMDLPLKFRTTLATIPCTVPYLQADPRKQQYWAQRLAAAESPSSPRRPRIGLTWSGSPAGRHNRNKSIPVAELSPLIDRIGDRAEVISLQKGLASSDAITSPHSRLRIRDYTRELRDFSDTAALMMNLDLIISVDTAVAHLAGALARPTWVPLALGPDWRWLEGREDSPWYPTMRLFRQTSWADWNGVIQQITSEVSVCASK